MIFSKSLSLYVHRAIRGENRGLSLAKSAKARRADSSLKPKRISWRLGDLCENTLDRLTLRNLPWAFLLSFCLCVIPSTLNAAVELYPIEKLQAGMRGTTYTVMRGIEPEPVETEILGVAKDRMGPGKDLIIARLIDPKTAITGAVHGMSGSPMYIDGKLVGALSRRLGTFEKDGHCGFTPIQDMLEVDQKVRASNRDKTASTRIGSSLFGKLTASSDSGAMPLSVPLTATGLDEAAVGLLLKKTGLQGSFIQAGAGSRSFAENLTASTLKPGSAVAAVMMTGSITMAGTGTLTWREGNRILAFGHPMLGMGSLEIGMAPAEILTIVPSYYYPYKLGNTGPIVGSITEDRFSAIGGLVGVKPRMARYHVDLEHEGKPKKPLDGDFVSHPLLTPMLVGAALVAPLVSSDDRSRIFSMEIEGEYQLAGHTPMKIGGMFSGQDGEIMLALMETLMPVIQVHRQEWEEVRAESLKLKIKTSERQQVWGIESVRAETKKQDRGGSLLIQVELRERLGGKETRKISVPLPESLKSGPVDIRVAGADLLDHSLLSKQLQSARSVEELIGVYNHRRPRNRMYIQVLSRTSGKIQTTQEQPGLPETIREVIEGGNRSEHAGSVNELIWTEKAEPVSGVIFGQEQVTVELRN